MKRPDLWFPSAGKDAPQEIADQNRDFICVGLKGEVAGIQQMDLRIRKVAPVGLGTGGNEGRIMAPPGRQKGRAVFAEIGLKVRIEGHVAAVVPDQIKLNLFGTRPRHIGDVEFIAIGGEAFRVCSGSVLPGPDGVR